MSALVDASVTVANTAANTAVTTASVTPPNNSLRGATHIDKVTGLSVPNHL